MKKVRLKITKNHGNADYWELDEGRQIFVKTTKNDTYETTVCEGIVIYYDNDFNIFSKKNSRDEECDFNCLKIIKIKENSIIVKAEENNCSNKTLVGEKEDNFKEVDIKNEFEIQVGQCVSFMPYIKDYFVTYSIYVDSIINE